MIIDTLYCLFGFYNKEEVLKNESFSPNTTEGLNIVTLQKLDVFCNKNSSAMPLVFR